MRVSENQNTDLGATSKTVVSNNLISIKNAVVKQGTAQTLDNSEETKAKVQEVVTKLNEILDVNTTTSKFMYHEGLERYYVTVVNRQTEEVLKEIPPKKLLDAFYEMQKMLGMVVDEKI